MDSSGGYLVPQCVGLSGELMQLIPSALIITSLGSPILTAISYFRGTYIAEKRTGMVSRGVMINFMVMISLMTLFILLRESAEPYSRQEHLSEP